jgi:hypothetical protein
MRTVGLVCHDAGGAQVVSCWAVSNNYNYLISAEGPARQIFRDNLVPGQYRDLEDVVNGSEFIITGTSWQSDLERKCISLAKSKGKRIVSYLDHWSNYSTRFSGSRHNVLPDEIWVTDEYAMTLACTTFPGIRVVNQGNKYLDKIARELEKIRIQQRCIRTYRIQNPRILYLAENIDDHAACLFGTSNGWGFNEKEAFSYCINGLQILNIKPASINVRPHPSHRSKDLDWINDIYGGATVITIHRSLIQDIMESDIVIGVESMGLVVALLAKKKVISAIPPGGKPCSLPHREIIHMSSLLNKSGNT